MLNKISFAFDHPDFLVVHKPFGYRVHRVNEGQWGLLETCASILGYELWPVHRLDKGTSGLLIFAKNKVAARQFFDLFESGQVKKEYCFLTRSKQNEINSPTANRVKESIEFESHIEKLDDGFISHSRKLSNSKTKFSRRARFQDFELWQADPQTGKPHQIRLHAQALGMPILGDLDYNGTLYFRLALHAERLEFKWNNTSIQVQAPLPVDFSFIQNSNQNLDSPNRFHSFGMQILAQEQNIRDWIDLKETDCFLLKNRQATIHNQDWSAERLGSVNWIKNYGQDFTQDQLDDLKSYSTKYNVTSFVRKMKDRGLGVGGEEKSLLTGTSSQLSHWTTTENGLRFEMRCDAGFSPGLFLDQREARSWVRDNSKSKNVLNLFSYTGGFSVNAAAGEAKQVTTVDVSQVFLDWSKENFRLNKLETNPHEFFKQDVILFLKGSEKRQRLWDLIICDPPTFGRSKDRVWKLEKDFPELLQMLFDRLTKHGQLLFTCNYEEWNAEVLKTKTKEILRGSKFSFAELPLPPIDFGCLDKESQMSYGFILKKH